MKKSISTLSALAALALLAACGETKNSSAPAASTPAATASAPATGSAPAAAESASGATTAALSPKDAVEERERLMKAYKKDFGLIGKMVKGETPYDAAPCKPLPIAWMPMPASLGYITRLKARMKNRKPKLKFGVNPMNSKKKSISLLPLPLL